MLEALKPFRIANDCGWQHLDGHISIKSRVARVVRHCQVDGDHGACGRCRGIERVRPLPRRSM